MFSWIKAFFLALFVTSWTAATANIPTGFWPRNQILLMIVSVLGLGATALDPFIRNLGWYKRTRKKRDQQAVVHAALGALLEQLVIITNASWASTGVFAHWGRCRHLPIPGIRRLKPLGGIRLKQLELDPTLHGINFSYNHGPIGTTWAEEDRICIDWAAVAEKLNQQLKTHERGSIEKRDWNKISSDERWRLSYRQFKQTRHYQLLVTHPIRDNSGATLGVVWADLRWDDAHRAISADEIRSMIDLQWSFNSAARTISYCMLNK